MKLLMSKNGGERGESPSLMKNDYKEYLSTKKNYQKQQKEGRIINLLDFRQECYETHLNGL